jgi:hypothetical protein
MELQDVVLENCHLVGLGQMVQPICLAGPNYSQDCKIVLLCFAFLYRKNKGFTVKATRLAHSSIP